MASAINPSQLLPGEYSLVALCAPRPWHRISKRRAAVRVRWKTLRCVASGIPVGEKLRQAGAPAASCNKGLGGAALVAALMQTAAPKRPAKARRA